MPPDQPRELSRLFKTPNNQSQPQHHLFRTPDTTASNLLKSKENTDPSPANIILQLSDADHAEAMSSAELRARTGGQIFLTKPVDVFQPTGKSRQRQVENSEDSWLCRSRGGVSIRARTNVGAITPTRIAMRRGVLKDGGSDEGRYRLGGVAEGDESEEGNESVDILETPDGEYTRGTDLCHETDDLDCDVLMGEADQDGSISQM